MPSPLRGGSSRSAAKGRGGGRGVGAHPIPPVFKRLYQRASSVSGNALCRRPPPGSALRPSPPSPQGGGKCAKGKRTAPMSRTLPHRTGALTLGGRTLVMGIVNVTPDSFSDGGVHAAPADAVAGALRMAAEGADILDVGGESTRPGHVAVAAEDEWARVAPVFDGLARGRAALPPLSIDTWKSTVARRAMAAGASLVNDVWGFQR